MPLVVVRSRTMISRILISACAAITLFFGSVHLAYTFFTDKLTPADGELETAMKHVAGRISSETTMWKAWVGFNVSHSNTAHAAALSALVETANTYRFYF